MTFPMDTPRKRIDFIFYRVADASAAVDLDVENVCVLERGQVDGVWPSDHHLLVADLTIQA